MRNSNNSKKIIFNTAKKLFWTKGYSNVSVRDIAKQSKYDIALISRYFGSKKKLFEETLKDVTEWFVNVNPNNVCLLYTSPSPRDLSTSRMPSSA